jgi:HEAT repeat protein
MAWTIRVALCMFIAFSLARRPALAEPDAAAGDLSNARGEEAFRKALVALKSKSAAERAAAADEMGRRGQRFRKEIADALRPVLLSDPESMARAAAGRALGRLGAREAVPELIKALSDKSADVRVVAAAALWRLPDPSAVPMLLARAKDTDKVVREWCALALGVAGDQRAAPELIRLLGDPERSVRLAAVRSLGKLNRPEALGPLVAYLSSGKRDEEEREEVVNSVASIEGSERVGALLTLLETVGSDTKLKLQLVLALAKVGDGQAQTTLKKLSQRDESRAVREAASQAYASVLGRLKARPDAGALESARPYAGRVDAGRHDAGRSADATRP